MKKSNVLRLKEDEVSVASYKKKIGNNYFFCILKINLKRESDPELDTDPEPDPDPLVRGTDLRILIQIHTKMSRITNTD
jgi:hypothetical protein